MSNSDISLAGSSSRLQKNRWDRAREGRKGCVNQNRVGMMRGKDTDSRMMIFPNPYQRPPAPTNAESLTLLASALSAFRTRELNGGGTVKSA